MTEGIRVVGLGAGGHAKVLLEALAAQGGYDVVGLLDAREDLWGRNVLGVPVLGDSSELPRQYEQGVSHAFIGLGGVGDNSPRRRLYELARSHAFDVVSVIHPRAIVSPSVGVGDGAAVLAGAVVGVGSRIGRNAIVNTAAVVEHDCRIADHAHVASGARIAGGVEVGEGAHIGTGATVIQGLRIGARAIVGAGAVVTKDIQPGTVVVGVPARPPMKQRELGSFQIAADASAREALACIDRSHCGIALVVDAEGRLLGTVTDGDIRRAMLADLGLEAPVTALLERQRELHEPRPVPLTAPAGSSPAELVALMQSYDIRQIPLIDADGRVQDLALLHELVEVEGT